MSTKYSSTRIVPEGSYPVNDQRVEFTVEQYKTAIRSGFDRVYNSDDEWAHAFAHMVYNDIKNNSHYLIYIRLIEEYQSQPNKLQELKDIHIEFDFDNCPSWVYMLEQKSQLCVNHLAKLMNKDGVWINFFLSHQQIWKLNVMPLFSKHN